MMRDNRRDSDYNNYNRFYNEQPEREQYQRYSDRNDSRRGPDTYYRGQQSDDFGRAGNYQGTQEDYYRSTYDISNYEGIPRSFDYGLPNGPDEDLDSVRNYPLSEGPYSHREQYRYNLGYNPNYDNPEEGDRYRDFDSRGNHGFRHDSGYGNTNEFREFDGDFDRRSNRPGDMDYWGY